MSKKIITFMIIIGFVVISACGQARKSRGNMQANSQGTYRGIFSEEGKIANLFPIRSTGVTTKPIVDAAKAFLHSLSQEQHQRILFDVQSEEWQNWSNVDSGIFKREGISLQEMTPHQKQNAFGLMQASLSAKGLQLSRDIMKTDQTLKEINNGDARYDEELYFFTIMGSPSETEPWGWQLDGHHLVINYFVLGDQVVMTPTFMGAEPVITQSGKYKGNTLFQDEQNIGLAFMQSLSKEQQNKATISTRKTRDNLITGAGKDNLTLKHEGLQASSLSAEHKKALLHLIFQYVSNMKEGHQKIKMEEVRRHIDSTWFAWYGETQADSVFYYRIHSPVVLIEFDHQRPVGLRGVTSRKPTKNHIHTIVRTPNGNDYGKDLLSQHLENHPH